MFNGIRKVLFRKRGAYRALFMPGDNMSPASNIVLADLRIFCKATTTPAMVSPAGTIDPIATGIAIGRLEVWHRITQHLHISDADLYRLVNREDSEDGTD